MTHQQLRYITLSLMLTISIFTAPLASVQLAFASPGEDWVVFHANTVTLINPHTGEDGEPDFKLYVAVRYQDEGEPTSILTYPPDNRFIDSSQINFRQEGGQKIYEVQLDTVGLSVQVPKGINSLIFEVKVVDVDAIDWSQMLDDTPWVKEKVQEYGNSASNGIQELLTEYKIDKFIPEGVMKTFVDAAESSLIDWSGQKLQEQEQWPLGKLLGHLMPVGGLVYDYLAEEDPLGTAKVVLQRNTGWLPNAFSAISLDHSLEMAYEVRVALGTSVVKSQTAPTAPSNSNSTEKFTQFVEPEGLFRIDYAHYLAPQERLRLGYDELPFFYTDFVLDNAYNYTFSNATDGGESVRIDIAFLQLSESITTEDDWKSFINRYFFAQLRDDIDFQKWETSTEGTNFRTVVAGTGVTVIGYYYALFEKVGSTVAIVFNTVSPENWLTYQADIEATTASFQWSASTVLDALSQERFQCIKQVGCIRYYQDPEGLFSVGVPPKFTLTSAGKDGKNYVSTFEYSDIANDDKETYLVLFIPIHLTEDVSAITNNPTLSSEEWMKFVDQIISKGKTEGDSDILDQDNVSHTLSVIMRQSEKSQVLLWVQERDGIIATLMVASEGNGFSIDENQFFGQIVSSFTWNSEQATGALSSSN